MGSRVRRREGKVNLTQATWVIVDGLDGWLLCLPQAPLPPIPSTEGDPRKCEPGDICLFLKARGLQA